MRQVRVAELKAKLSEYLRAAHSGQEILVEARGRPVAVLGAVRLPEGDDAALALVRDGLARPQQKALPADFWQMSRPTDPHCAVRAALLAERDEG